jgi:tRNA1(Val) A37 N6-methylase TrmN6
VRLAPEFAAGFTAGYFSKVRDRYAFQSSQDSVALATRMGFPTAASVLDQGTGQRWLRLGFALTYHTSSIEGGFSIEQTVSGAGLVPGATVYRLVLRPTRKLF